MNHLVLNKKESIERCRNSQMGRDIKMPGTWVTDLTHFLDEDGDLAFLPDPAFRLAEYFTSIVAMASHPDLVIPPQFRVHCRRRPGRKPCSGMIESDLDFETEDIIRQKECCLKHLIQ